MNLMLDDIEKWVVEHYGKIESESVQFPQLNSAITAVAVPIFNGLVIGMGTNRQLAIHDLYLRLTMNPKLNTGLNDWWKQRFAESMKPSTQ